jgi:hypothetical protein
MRIAPDRRELGGCFGDGFTSALQQDATMSMTRRVFLNLVFAFLILGSAYDIATDQEHWPFSQYPMFAGEWRSPTFTWLRLFGVTADGREIALASNRYIAPFDLSRLPKALRRMMDERDGARRIAIAVGDCLTRYEQLRAQHRHDGPPLAAMRLYEVEWRIDARASNVDRPERRTLISEVARQ